MEKINYSHENTSGDQVIPIYFDIDNKCILKPSCRENKNHNTFRLAVAQLPIIDVYDAINAYLGFSENEPFVNIVDVQLIDAVHILGLKDDVKAYYVNIIWCERRDTVDDKIKYLYYIATIKLSQKSDILNISIVHNVFLDDKVIQKNVAKKEE